MVAVVMMATTIVMIMIHMGRVSVLTNEGHARKLYSLYMSSIGMSLLFGMGYQIYDPALLMALTTLTALMALLLV